MDKRETLCYLYEHGVVYELTEHQAVFNMAEAACVELPYPDRDAKNLFVRDDKKRAYYLISTRADRRIDLKRFGELNGTRRLSFASEADLAALLGLSAGSVTPLGLLNDDGARVELFLDSWFMDGIIGVHPNDNTATVWLQTKDLVRVIEDHGNAVHVVDMENM